MRKKIGIFLFIFSILSNLNFGEITSIASKFDLEKDDYNTEKILEKIKGISSIGENIINKKPINLETVVRVKLSYKNPKIEKKNGIFYVNGNPYRGVIHKDGDDIINIVSLEDYLYSVVSAEMPVYFGAEALKAQSVAARTYAYNTIINSKNKNFDVYDTNLSQVYKGMSNEKKEVIKTVDATKGEIATYNNKPILALYHSSSGDRTKSSKEIFGEAHPYLVSVEDYSNSKKWNYTISKKSLESKFRKTYLQIVNLNKNKIRRVLGSNNIKSTNFKMKQIGANIYFSGKGFGHGVGLSQWGAKYLGEVKKYNYKKILEHYYKGIKIQKIGDIK